MNGSAPGTTPTAPPVSPDVRAPSNDATCEAPARTAASASDAKSFSTRARGGDYEHAVIEAHWQAAWSNAEAFATPPPTDEREPAYVFAGNLSPAKDLHVGHIRGYTIADAYARFLRARGRAVLFSLGFDAFGPSIEDQACQQSTPPGEWVARRCARLRIQLLALGCSIDWERSFVSSEPEQCRWTQRLFSALLEHGLIYRSEGQADEWRLRTAAYMRESERDLEALHGWDAAALTGQREVLGRVDGVELDASTFDGTLLTVFTSHPNAIAQAAFVAVAPDHPNAERWRTGAFATVPGVAGVLPIVVSEEVGARFGTTAVLGIPAKDPADAAIAQRLPEPAGTTWKVSKTSAAPRPAARWRVRDMAISNQSEVWSWLALCVPPAGRGEELPEHPEFARWLPVAQIVRGADTAEETLHQRMVAKALQDAGQLPKLPDREPFANALTYGALRPDDHAPGGHFEDAFKLDALLAMAGADTLRLALLHAASPSTAFVWNDQPLRYCQIFLENLYGYAEGRLREWSPRSGSRPHTAQIDASDKLRRRLVNWCWIARGKVTENLEQLQTQRAAHNAMLLFTRIQDFECRALERHGGELEQADREAIVAALSLLAQLLAPLTPHIAEELWSLAGNDTLLSSTSWPTRRSATLTPRQRERRAGA
jgi:leucyl-tRNA synthetase